MFRNLRELYHYRALLWALVVRYLAMRYRGSILGFFWSFLNPLCLMLVYVLVFRYYIRFEQVQNYTVFVFCGLLPWIWFSSALLEGTVSVVANSHLITRSMFPAHILPAVAVLTSMVNYILSLPILIVLMLSLGVKIHITFMALPLVVAGQVVLLYGLALGLAALNVYFRDVQHIVGNLLTFLFFLCPILYPLDVVPERFRFSMYYNPLAGMIRFYQQLILDGRMPSLVSAGYFVLCMFLALAAGNWIYNSYREGFAEIL